MKTKIKSMIATDKLRKKKVYYKILFNQLILNNMNKYLKGLGLKKEKDIQDFIRGSIFAGIGNAHRAESKDWQKFIKAVQPLAKKHLGTSLTLGGAKEIRASGEIR